jgi:hypothetical protein
VLSNVPVEHIDQLAADLADAVAVLVVAGRSRGEGYGDLDTVADAVVASRLGEGSGASAADLLLDVAQADGVDIGWLFGQVLVNKVIADNDNDNDNGTDIGSGWAEDVVAGLSARGTNGGPTTVAEFRDACWPYVRELSAEAAEKFFRTYADVAETWIAEHVVGDFDKQRLGFHRFS